MVAVAAGMAAVAGAHISIHIHTALPFFARYPCLAYASRPALTRRCRMEVDARSQAQKNLAVAQQKERVMQRQAEMALREPVRPMKR